MDGGANGLSLDLPMIENYISGPRQAAGTGDWNGGPGKDGAIRHWPQQWNPIVNMPEAPGEDTPGPNKYNPATDTLTASPQQEAATAWMGAITADLYSTLWFLWDQQAARRFFFLLIIAAFAGRCVRFTHHRDRIIQPCTV